MRAIFNKKKTMIRKIQVLAVLFWLTSSIALAQSTVYFYRLKNIYMANTSCKVTVNDTARFIINNGGYHEVVTSAGHIAIKTLPANTGLQELKLEKGKSYYVEIRMKGLNSVELVQVDEFTARPAIERLKADERAQQAGEENLKTLKVTEVPALPQPNPEVAQIYLFRPYNIAGVSLMIKVAAEDSLFIMKNYSAHTYSTKSSEITLRTVNEQVNTSNSSLHLKLEKGKVYYVAVLRSSGALLLTEAKEGYARTEMKLK